MARGLFVISGGLRLAFFFQMVDIIGVLLAQIASLDFVVDCL
jgi:hypothetical protein